MCGQPSAATRCAEHRLADDRDRSDNPLRRHRSPRWKRLSTRLRRRRRSARLGADDDLTIDHIIPVSEDRALAFSLANLRVLCRSCNSSRGNRATAADRAEVHARLGRPGDTPRIGATAPSGKPQSAIHTGRSRRESRPEGEGRRDGVALPPAQTARPGSRRSRRSSSGSRRAPARSTAETAPVAARSCRVGRGCRSDAYGRLDAAAWSGQVHAGRRLWPPIGSSPMARERSCASSRSTSGRPESSSASPGAWSNSTTRLAARVQVFREKLYNPTTDSYFRLPPAEPKRLEGLDYTLAIPRRGRSRQP